MLSFPTHTSPYSSSLRTLERSSGNACFRTYYDYDTVPLLVACLDNQNIAEPAAEALRVGLTRDITAHMVRFDQDDALLNMVMDVMYRSTAAVQSHLTNLLHQAVKWPKAKVFVTKLLNNGLLSLMSFMLKTDLHSTQEAAISVLSALLQKVTHVPELQKFMDQLVDDFLLTNIIEIVTNITLQRDFKTESVCMFNLATIYEVLSNKPTTHPALLAYSSSQIAQQRRFTVSTGVGATAHTSINAFTQMVKLLGALGEKKHHMDSFGQTIASIMSFCHNIVSHASQRDRDEFLRSKALLLASLQVTPRLFFCLYLFVFVFVSVPVCMLFYHKANAFVFYFLVSPT